MSIEIANESGYDVDADEIVAVARHALDEMGVNPLAELSVLLVDVDYMTELNHRWMGGDGPTDVLAFPMDELRPGLVNEDPEEGILGDMVLCPSVAERQAVLEKMNRLLVAYMPYKVHVNRVFTDMAQPNVRGLERNIYRRDFWQYLDLEGAAP